MKLKKKTFKSQRKLSELKTTISKARQLGNYHDGFSLLEKIVRSKT
jgi:hypothetical protein